MNLKYTKQKNLGASPHKWHVSEYMEICHNAEESNKENLKNKEKIHRAYNPIPAESALSMNSKRRNANTEV